MVRPFAASTGAGPSNRRARAGTRPACLLVLCALLGATPAFGAPTTTIRVLDASGSELAHGAWASIERTPPAGLDEPDPDALRFMVIAAPKELPLSVVVRSFAKGSVAPEDAPLDRLETAPLTTVPCPSDVGSDEKCGETLPIRAVMDELDREHPLVRARSIRAELGGTITVTTPDGKAKITLAVRGPRSLGADVDGSLSATLEVRLVRLDPGGAPPVGSDDADAIARTRAELARAARVWSQCGVTLGDPRTVNVTVVDPPPPHLLALGCDAGAPATGGLLRFEVDGKSIEAKLPPGTMPRGAARIAASAVEKAGFEATIFEGRPGRANTYAPVDVSVRTRKGALATLSSPARAGSDGVTVQPSHASTDATLDACIGSVWLGDGLDHFTDATAAQGSLEERTLLRAFDDGDPRTVDVFVVPSFGGMNRIGESFVFADRSSIRNVVIEDRVGFRSDGASFTLAHELGHVLLDDAGHPDDFDADTPTLLMDSDAVNGTVFGPRRITVDECARVLRESGPGSASGILRRVPVPSPKTRVR